MRKRLGFNGHFAHLKAQQKPINFTTNIHHIHQITYNTLIGRPFVQWFALCYRTVVLVLSVFNVGVLWPNAWMDQDKTWHARRPRPWPHCVRWGLTSPSTKGAQPPNFGPCLLWSDGRPSQLLLSTCKLL